MALNGVLQQLLDTLDNGTYFSEKQVIKLMKLTVFLRVDVDCARKSKILSEI